MKRFVLFCAVMVFALATYAQTPNRILVVDKTRAYKGFAINQLAFYYRLTGAVQVKAISIHIKLEPKRVGKLCIDLFHY